MGLLLQYLMEKLKPFGPIDEKISLEGELFRAQDKLRLRFHIDDPSRVLLDGPAAKTWKTEELCRADGLWKTTCFEAFWGIPGDEGYWELNLSGSGQWNLYRFESYRQPLPPKTSHDFSVESFITTKNSLYCLLSAAEPVGQIQASLCAVVRTPLSMHYFSTMHCGPKPDFHLRNSFSLQLGES